jgi:hypothetical protein
MRPLPTETLTQTLNNNRRICKEKNPTATIYGKIGKIENAPDSGKIRSPRSKIPPKTREKPNSQEFSLFFRNRG